MTTITANASLSLFQTSPQSAAGTQLTIAAGILGSALNPLNASARAFAVMPSIWSLSMFTAAQAKPQAQFTASTGADGKASIDLGDGYSMQLNENNSEITIFNANTNESTKIWGDPHVEVDGKHAFDFAGTTTFELENGTKVTIGTEQWGGNPDAYVASDVTITKGDQAVVVSGISQNKLGDLSIAMSQNGRAIDAATRDGYVLKENAAGSGWISSISGKVATQADLDATKVGGLYGPGSEMPSIAEMSDAITSFLFGGAALFSALEIDAVTATAFRAPTATLSISAYLQI